MAEEEPIEYLVSRRPKRSTAGNSSISGFNSSDEQDVFESDFESTDEEEEMAQGDTEAGEKQLQTEERRERQAARSKLEKATAAAHARNKASFNPELASSSAPKPKPRVRIQEDLESPVASTSTAAVQPEESTTPLGEDPRASNLKRKSSRAHTVNSTTRTAKRLKELQRDKALAPKKTKSSTKILTQAQLIARALDNEGGNIEEHRDYLKNEEEKRRQARVVRETVTGPALRWVSKAEEITVKVTPPPTPQIPQSLPLPVWSTSQLTPQFAGASLTGYIQQPYTPAFASTSSSQPHTVTGGSFINQYHSAGPTHNSQSTPSSSTPAQRPSVFGDTIPQSMIYESTPPAPSLPQTRIEKVCKNYVIHEHGQERGAKKPTWASTMKAMFGKGVDWEELKVYKHVTEKQRPFTRPVMYCPFTGKPAPYRDPKTGLPYADIESFKKSREMLRHRYIWNTGLSRYVGVDESIEPEGPLGEGENGGDFGL